MAIRDRILEYLAQHPEGADDDELAGTLQLAQRQTANIHCRQLAVEGLIRRVKQNGTKIRNFPLGGQPAVAMYPPPKASPCPAASSGEHSGTDRHSDWYWEGNVQSMAIKYLVEQGYAITRACDTSRRERGKDIEARSGDRALWVTVKGYPHATEKTPPTLQAAHWFSGALFDIICWRGEDSEAELAFALPDFPRYRNLAQRVAWLKSAARFSFLWVSAGGSVSIER